MKKIYKKILKYSTALLIVYLISNIVWSQNISKTYFNIVDIKSSKKEVQNYVFNFLVSIKKLPSFNSYLSMYKSVFGSSLEQSIKDENEKRSVYLNKLNIFLQNNPKSRDVLYKLYVYYVNEGDRQMAKQYIEKVKEIDPNFKFKQ